jgi:hypothetical protein
MFLLILREETDEPGQLSSYERSELETCARRVQAKQSAYALCVRNRKPEYVACDNEAGSSDIETRSLRLCFKSTPDRFQSASGTLREESKSN